MIQSPTSARQQTSSSSPWWSGPRGSLISQSCPWMTRSSCYVQVSQSDLIQFNDSGEILLSLILVKTIMIYSNSFKNAQITGRFLQTMNIFLQFFVTMALQFDRHHARIDIKYTIWSIHQNQNILILHNL